MTTPSKPSGAFLAFVGAVAFAAGLAAPELARHYDIPRTPFSPLFVGATLAAAILLWKRASHRFGRDPD